MKAIFEQFDISGRVAVVTGGAGLLGAEFCRTLAEAGARVVVADLNEPGVSNVVATLKSPGLGVKVDVTSPDSVGQMVETTIQAYNRLDILVNSAALDPKFDPEHAYGDDATPRLTQPFSSHPTGSRLPHAYHFEDYPLDLWNQSLNVNLTGNFLCCQAAVKPMLIQGQGVIINLCSIYGLVGPDQRLYQREGQPAQFKPIDYSVTKAGVLGLTRYLATYFAGENIRVNALTPGGVYNDHDESFVRSYSARTVIGRMARRDELNGALLFLASDASSYMTGANLVVDGGWTAW